MTIHPNHWLGLHLNRTGQARDGSRHPETKRQNRASERGGGQTPPRNPEEEPEILTIDAVMSLLHYRRFSTSDAKQKRGIEKKWLHRLMFDS